MREALRQRAREIIAEELAVEPDEAGRIAVTDAHVRYGAMVLGAGAAGLTALQLGAVGYAAAQQNPGAGSIGTAAHPLEEIYADTVSRETDVIDAGTLSIGGNELVLDPDATVANEAQNVRVTEDAIEIGDGTNWDPAMAEYYGGGAWGGAVVEQYRSGSWRQLYPETAIPDSEGLHARYDWTQASGTSSVTDQTGNGHDLTGTYTGPTASINGNQAGEFDGSDDVLDVSFSTIDQPTTIAWVGRYDGTIGDGDQDVAFDQVGTNDAHQFFVDEGAGDTSAFTTTGLTGPPSTNDATVYVVIFDGSNSEVHVDNNSTSGDAGTGPMQDGLTVGADQSGGRNFEGAMVEMLVYPKNQSSIVGDIKSYLADQANLTL